MKRFGFLSLAAVILTGICSADTVYTVSLNTNALIGNANAPFALDFQLISGDITSGVINAATLAGFSFGSGGSAGTGSPFANSGNANGSLVSTVTLNTSGASFFNEFSQFFTPGNTLSFQLDLTNNSQPGGTPDEFTFQLIDNTSSEISTADPSGSDSLIVIDLTGTTLAPQIYPLNGDGITSTPTLMSSTPEPSASSYVLLAGVLFVLAVRYQPKRPATR